VILKVNTDKSYDANNGGDDDDDDDDNNIIHSVYNTVHSSSSSIKVLVFLCVFFIFELKDLLIYVICTQYVMSF